MAESDAETLLGGRWAPVTYRLAFFQATVDDAVESFMSWRGAYVRANTGHPLSVATVRGSLPDLLGQLLPLTSHMPRRYLFLPTAATGSPWTAFFDNSWRGADTGSEMTAFAARGITGVAIFSAENTYNPQTNTGFHGIQRFQTVWKDDTTRHGFTGRTIGVQVGDSGWETMDSGEPLPFEDTTSYRKRRRQDRVTQPLLRTYAAAMGLRPFDENFYAPDRRGILIQHTEPPVAGARQFTLEEARSGLPFDTIGAPAR